MAKRELQEINAGSMADIAFLLLIFFLVTTTMATDQGIERSLPKKEENPPEIPVIQRNIFEISVNFRDQVAVEGKYIALEQMNKELRDFYTNPNNSRSDMPELKRISKSNLEILLTQNEYALSQDTENKALISNVEKIKGQLQAIEYFGEYNQLPKIAFVAITTDQKSSYNRFVEIYNQIEATINELKNEASLEYFNVPMLELDEKIEEDRNKLRALRLLYPKRIVTPELRSAS